MSTDLAAADQYAARAHCERVSRVADADHRASSVLENVVDGVGAADADTLQSALNETSGWGSSSPNSSTLPCRRRRGPLHRRQIDVHAFLSEAVNQASVGHRMNTIDVDVEPLDMARPWTGATASGRCEPPRQRLSTQSVGWSDRGLSSRDERYGRPRDRGVRQRAWHAADERSNVFERFTRGGSSDGGTGLGLAIAGWAVDLHGGTIAVVGDEPGCRIRVTLPPG